MAHGARFTFAHAHAVVTLTSHASILTGRYPYEHGIRDNTGYRLGAKEATAATLLKAQGFSTGAFVGGFPLDHRFGLTAGFDQYDDRMTTATTFAEATVGRASPDASERERPADVVVKSALDWIAAKPGKWFAWVHVYDPSGRIGDAVRTFTRLLALDTSNALAYQNLGTAHLHGKDYTSAEASLRRAVQLDQSLAGAYTALGVVLAGTGRKAEAIDAWTRAAALGDPNAIENLRLSGR